MHTKQLVTFRRLVLLTIALIYLVILAGAVVRGTGSGMGCPDWPKCFGTWIPPTDISQLSPDYKEIFKVANHHIADFNPVKTWIEYVNRLLGVLVGFSVFATLVYSLKLLSLNKSLFLFSFLILVFTGFQGWIGARVVATNLSEYMITIHMFIALLILSMSIFLLHKVSNYYPDKPIFKGNYSSILFALMLLTLVQVLVGTQVRQEIDTVSILYNESNRELWINLLSEMFSFHRVVAILVIVSNLTVCYFFVRQNGFATIESKLLILITVVLFLEYLTGIIMVRFSLPFLSQPIHLLLATIVFGIQFYFWLSVSRFRQSFVSNNVSLN
jgi:cytochrome c oxidase assembly protein subunit 15